MTPLPEKDIKKYFWLIFAFGLIVRVVRAFAYTGIKKDAVLYVNMARAWSKGGADAAFDINSSIPPLWPWLMGIGETIGFGAENTALTVGVVFGGILPVAVFYIASHIFDDKKYALVAAVIATCHPYLINLSVWMLRDSLYVPLVAIAIAVAMSAVDNKSYWRWLIVGIVAGVAVMTRREGFEIIIFIACWSAVAVWRERCGEWKSVLGRQVASVAICCMGYCAVSLPVQFALSDTKSQWSFVDRSMVRYYQMLTGREAGDVYKAVGGE